MPQSSQPEIAPLAERQPASAIASNFMPDLDPSVNELSALDAADPSAEHHGDPDPLRVRWNLSALMLDVTFFSIGMAFMDASAILPLLLDRLGASGVLIGAFAAIRFLAFSLFQILIAYATHNRPRQKPLLSWIAATTRLPLLALPWFLWRAAESPTARFTALWATIVILTIWALGDGLGYVPWMEIVARAFTDKIRGRFFAATQLASGVIGIAVAALVVRGVLAASGLPFPYNYALLAGVSALMFQISLIGVLMIREPPPPAISETQPLPPLGGYLRRLPSVLRGNPIFARLALVQLLVGFGAAAAPFYVLYATARFRLGDEWGAYYQVMQALGVVILMPAWALISERRSPAASVRCVALTCLVTPLLALTIGGVSPWLFGLVFLLMGGSLNWGLWITFNHYLLTHVRKQERSLFIALLSLLFMPSAIYPYVGGLLVQHKTMVSVGGMPVLFVASAAVIAIGAVLAWRLPAPDTESGSRTVSA